MPALTSVIWVTLRNGKTRKIEASSGAVTWVHGRQTKLTVAYQSAKQDSGTLATTKKIDTIVHEVEFTPGTGGSSGQSQSNTVSAFAILAASSTSSGSVPLLDANMQILDCTVWDYIRVTGTGLPTAGIYLSQSDVVAMNNVDPAATDSL